MKASRPVKISAEVAAKCDAPNQFANFDALVRSVLAVPHSEIVRRERNYKRQADANPRKRGPRPRTDASRDLHV